MAEDAPRPGMPQSEKDKLGRRFHEAEQRRLAAERGEIVVLPDEQLENLTKDELLEEAERRGVEVKTSATKTEIAAALRGDQEQEA